MRRHVSINIESNWGIDRFIYAGKRAENVSQKFQTHNNQSAASEQSSFHALIFLDFCCNFYLFISDKCFQNPQSWLQNLREITKKIEVRIAT